MSDIERTTLISDEGHQELELSPYSEVLTFMEIHNAMESAFFIMSKETARQLADKLIKWAGEE